MKLKELRKAAGYTQQKLADKMGVSRTTVTMWESGTDCGMENAQRLAKLFDVPVDALISSAPHVSPGAVRVPVYGTIPAGVPMEAIEDIIDYEEIPQEWTRGGREFFGLRIKGDSMYPRYEDGDVIIFKRQDTCENGQDCAVMVNGDDATFKRVKLSDRAVVLVSLNPNYEPMIYAPNDVRIIGVVYELRRKL